MNKLIIGVDPGINGATAFIELDSKYNTINTIFLSTPSIQRVNKKGRAIACPALVKSIQGILVKYPKHEKYAILESVHSISGQGISSSFTFGKTVGIVEGIFTTLEIPITLVTPQAWKKHFGLLKQEKDASRQYVIALYPELSKQFKLKKHTDKADAFLIALYGVKLLNV